MAKTNEKLTVLDSGEDVRTIFSLYETSLRKANIAFWAWDERVDKSYLISDLLYEILEITKDRYHEDREYEDPVYQVIHPGDIEKYKLIDRLPPYEDFTDDDPDSYRIDYRIIVASGGIKHLREHGHVLRDISGAITWSYGTIQDITDLKEIEQELKNAQRIASVGSWVWSVEDNQLVSCSEEFARIHGVEPNEVEEHFKHQFERIIYPEDRERLAAEFDAADRVNEDFDARYRIVRPDGAVRYVHEVGEYIPHRTDGQKTLQRGIIQDITDQVLSEQIIARQSSQFNFLYEVAKTANEANTIEEALHKCLTQVCKLLEWPLGCICWHSDTDKGVSRSNCTWYSSDQARYQNFIGASEDQKKSNTDAMLEQVWLQGSELWVSDISVHENMMAATECGLLSAHHVPIFSDGEVVAVMQFLLDKPKRPDVELADVLNHVALQLGQVFGRQRREKSLENALAIAEQSSRAKTDFLSSMSHELRTPLNAILGFAQLLQTNRANPGSDKHKTAVEHILGAGEHLLDLINNILELNQIEAGKIPLTFEPVSIVSIVDECILMIEGRAREDGISIQKQLRLASRELITDRTRLTQILLNLLSNAVKYNIRGGTVILRDELRDNSMYRLYVIDTGDGIDEEAQVTIFNPFERLGREAGRIEGSGIGLSIARQLAELLGGSMGLSSKPGEGSKFWIDLPEIVD